MLKIAILTDGPYGDRAYDTIKKKFDTEYIHLNSPNEIVLDDEIEIPSNIADKIIKSNIIISYISHPDLITEIVERFANKVDWIIVASWKGNGLKKELEKKDNVTCPYIMCEIEKNGNPIYDEFLSEIGKPEIELFLKNGKINDVKVVRSSPCGSTSFVADYILKKYKGEIPDKKNLSREAGFKVQHYPCRGSKIRLFSEEESKKQLASKLHQKAFDEALEKASKK